MGEPVKLRVNGIERAVDADPATPLLSVLRGQLALTGTHFGCGAGGCGACNVLLDEHAVNACDTPLWAAAGKDVTTVEGLGTPERPHPLQRAFIAEQAMLGAAMGMAARGAIPFPATFAAFLTRAADFIRMLAISKLNVKMVGSHSGVSIGEDGPSQMSVEEIALATSLAGFVVIAPADEVS